MNTNQLSYFISVAELKSFTKTAEKFFISQTAVSKQIFALEQALGVKLFQRDNHNVSLTPAGEVYYTHAVKILKQVDTAASSALLAASGFMGSFRIGFSKGFEKTDISNLIFGFHNQNPNISIHFNRMNDEELLIALNEGEIDVAYTQLNEDTNRQEFNHLLLGTYPYFLVVHPTHHLSTYPTVTAFDIVDENILLLQENNDYETILLQVSANIGIAVLPKYCLNYLEQSSYLIMIPIVDQPELHIGSVWLEMNQNPAFHQFITYMEEIYLPSLNDHL